MLTETLHVYVSDDDWVIASSPEDAERVLNDACGTGDLEGEGPGWRQVDDARKFPLWIKDGDLADEGEGEHVQHTAAEWCRILGRTYLGTSS